jgi:hypothetical protein
MKTYKREKLMKRLAAVALLLGVCSPLAQAEVSDDIGGLSYSDLKRVVRSLEVRRDGNTILFAGFMPKACADNTIPSHGYDDGKHVAVIRMPNFPQCLEDFKKLPESERKAAEVDVADVFGSMELADESGSLHLRRYNNVSKNASAEDRITDDLIKARNGKEIAVIGKEARGKEAEAAKKAKEEAERAKLAEALRNKALKFCQDGDYASLGAEIMGASAILGEVTGMLEQISHTQKEKIKKDLAKAANAEEAAAAHEAYVAAASANGWDEEELKAAYIEKRFELLTAATEEAKAGEAKLSDADALIRSWMTDYKGLVSRSVFEKKKSTFAEHYAELGTHAMNKSDTANAEKYLDRAKALSNVEGKIKIDGAISKLYAEQFKACVEKSPTKMEACEKQFMSKAKSRADSIERALKSKGEAGKEELAAFQGEKIATFGGGQASTVAGFGNLTQVPGAIQQFKQQKYQEYMQQQQMLQMQRAMGVPVQGTAPAAAGTSFLGIAR